MDERRDVQASLADMDRRLREIQHELDLLSQPSQNPPPTSATSDPPAAPAPPAAPDAQAEADAIVARSRAEAARIVDEAAEQVAAIGAQIDEFQRLRDELQRSAQALVAEYERAVQPSAPGTSATPEPTTPRAEGRQFEGEVVLDAGPFADIEALGTLERALAGLAQTEDVYVRGLQGNRALIDVKLAGPVPLLEELRRVLPFAFDLIEIGYGRVTIDVSGPGAPSPPAGR